MKPRKPIFYDEQRLRWRRTSRVLEICGALFTLLIIIFFISILVSPRLPEPLLPAARSPLHPIVEKSRPRVPAKRPGRHKRVSSLGQMPATYDPLRAAFYVSWDPTSLAALQHHYRDIDVLIPERLHSITSSGRLDVEADPKLAAWMQSLQQTSNIEIPTMPLLNNSDGTNWLTDEMSAMLQTAAARQHLTDQAVQYLTQSHSAGLVVDFEEIPQKSQKDFTQFVAELAAALHRSNLKLMVCLPAADWAYDYANIGKSADAVVLMNYDQHWRTSAVSLIAAQDWFVRNIDAILKLIPPPRKLVMGIASYAYDWPSNAGKKAHEQAKVESFQESIVTAQESEAQVQFDADSLNPYYSYSDEHNHTHHVWMLDGVTAYNELRVKPSEWVYRVQRCGGWVQKTPPSGRFGMLRV